MTKFFLLLTVIVTATGIYDYKMKDINGNDLSLDNFRGKWILIVNTASYSKYSEQYGSLEKLYQQHKDSLVVIAVPSNSFGHETGDNYSIKKFVTGKYNAHFILAQKTEVSGTNQEPIYNWLTQQNQNGVMSNRIKNDFYKFLIDKSGNLVGVFDSSVDPMSADIQSAISN